MISDQEELLLFVLPAVQNTLDVWRQEKYWRRQRALEFVASMKQKFDAALVPAPPETPAPYTLGLLSCGRMVMGEGGGVAGGDVDSGAGVSGGAGTSAASNFCFIEATNSMALCLLQYFSCRQTSNVFWTAGRTNSKSSSWSKIKNTKII